MHPLEVNPHEIDFSDFWYKAVELFAHESVKIGSLRIEKDSLLDFGFTFGQIAVSQLWNEAASRSHLTDDNWHPQLAAYVFSLTRKPQAMNGYFPLTSSLNDSQWADFYQLTTDLAHKSTLEIRLIGEKRVDRTDQMPPDVEFLIAGHLAEIFFYRQDILKAFFKSPKRFWFYTTPQAYTDDGGIAGGMFNPGSDAIHLVLSRLYEGFRAPTPGVAPFLHELGHMLDHFDPTGNPSNHSAGLLPGLRPNDNDLYSSDAHTLFQQGKRLELERYLNLHHGTAQSSDPIPIGHPYVFQNDGEFIAGYLEMFFRNPHYFAHQNSDLYAGFSTLFRQDPRTYWREDFPFYVQQNRDYYLHSGKRPPAPNLTIS